jgi:GrpB-like predicted nucleotidyltransferase (UPF0157 family)
VSLSDPGREAEIHVVAWDDAWPARFEQERELLVRAIGEFIVGSVEHVGSTAVTGLAAKPVIDIMVGVAGLDESRAALPALETAGYTYYPYRPDVMHWLCKPSAQHRTHHLHLIPFGGQLWNERLAFRDHLRNNPRVAAEYAALKYQLAERYRTDREAYTDAKSEFVRAVVESVIG